MVLENKYTMIFFFVLFQPRGREKEKSRWISTATKFFLPNISSAWQTQPAPTNSISSRLLSNSVALSIPSTPTIKIAFNNTKTTTLPSPCKCRKSTMYLTIALVNLIILLQKIVFFNLEKNPTGLALINCHFRSSH